MHIRPVDVHDDREFHAYYRAAHRANTEGREYPTFWSEPEVAQMFRATPTDEKVEAYAAFDGDRVVGTGAMFVPLLANLDKAMFFVDALPERRREGIGSALVGYTLERARETGRSMIIGNSFYPMGAGEDHPHRAFAAKHGFTLANHEVRRLLELPMTEDVIQGWIDESAPHHAGYRIEHYVDDQVPEHLLPTYVHALNQIPADAPTGDIDFEADALTVDIYRENTTRELSSGRTVHRTIAVKDDEVVAWTHLVCPPTGADLPYAHQWGTLVLAGHRGHRLGMAVKAANLRAFQSAHPERTVVTTSNAPVNAPMVAVNERMGFRPVEILAEFVRRV